MSLICASQRGVVILGMTKEVNKILWSASIRTNKSHTILDKTINRLAEINQNNQNDYFVLTIPLIFWLNFYFLIIF